MAMDKRALVELLIEAMEADFEAAFRASRDAASYATDEEARAETKWDTQGLEASYFAAGKAGQAHALAASIAALRAFEPERCEVVELGAVVECEIGGHKTLFFIAPVGGGKEIVLDSNEVTVVTPDSPVSQAMDGKGAGAGFTLGNGLGGTICRCL